MSEDSASTPRRTGRCGRYLRLMADYGSAGLWDHDDRPLDPAKLPLNPKLRERLACWCAGFQASFENEINLETFAAEGRGFWIFAGGGCTCGRGGGKIWD